MSNTETVDVSSLTQLCVDAFRHAGLSQENAQISSGILIEADMMGFNTHGVVRVPEYTDRLRRGGVNPSAAIDVDRRAPSLAVVGGDTGLTVVVGMKAL